MEKWTVDFKELQVINIGAKEQEIQQINEQKELNIEDIINLDIKLLDQYKIINYNYEIINYLNTLIFEKKDGIDIQLIKNLLTYLKWVFESSTILVLSIKQKIISFQINGEPVIKRSSYNFCPLTISCKKYYNGKTATCINHHLPHNLFSHDIESLISYFEFNLGNLDIINSNINNIHTSFKTLLFVIKNMKNEINVINTNNMYSMIPNEFIIERTPNKQITRNQDKNKKISAKQAEKPKVKSNNPFDMLG